MMRYLLPLAVVALLVSLLTGVTQIRPGERAVIRRFGRVLKDTPGPGLYIGLPWSMEQVNRVPINLVRQLSVGINPAEAEESSISTPSGQLLTGDHNLVNLRVAIDYAVIEEQVVDYVLLEDRADTLVTSSAEAALAQWVAARTVDDVLLHAKAELPDHLVDDLQTRLAPYRLGIRIQNVSVTALSPPADVRGYFDDVTRAHTEIRKKVYEAEQEANNNLREAEAKCFNMERQTAAYAREQRLLAQAEAENFEKRLAQYQRLSRENPAHLNGIWWDEISRLYQRMRATGRIDLLDHRLATDGVDITQFPPLPKKN
jgi:membrane protease subunit HflK